MNEQNSVTAQQLGIQHEIPLPKRRDWRIGMVGFGLIASYHADSYKKAGWNIVAIADPDPEARDRAVKAVEGVRLHSTYEDLIADDDVEVISLLTQPTLREPVVAAAAKAGKPLMTEKPLGTDLVDCERMVEHMDKAGVPFAVSQNYRWGGANFIASQIIEKGLIGTPFFGSIEIYGRQDVDLKDHPFYSKCTNFLTLQWNNHLADLLRFWLRKDARRVFALTRRMEGQNYVSDNLLFSIADFGDGCTGNIVHSELLRSELRGAPCRVDGDEGSIVFNLHGSEVRLHSPSENSEPVTVTWPPMLPSMSGTMGDLLLSIEEGREPLVSARRNLATIRQILAEEESVQAGGAWVAID